jgi:hypothetical protein
VSPALRVPPHAIDAPSFESIIEVVSDGSGCTPKNISMVRFEFIKDVSYRWLYSGASIAGMSKIVYRSVIFETW